MGTSSRPTSISLLLVCLYSTAVSIVSSSSSSSSTYTVPRCQSVDGFYCPAEGNCLPRIKRCTGDGSAPLCERKTYLHCDYVSTRDKFKVYRYSTPLGSFGSSSRNPLDCVKIAWNGQIEHQFITYRGLMFEFGTYGTRVQDPNDPNYEYNTRSWRDQTYLGDSSCTYDEVLRYMDMWNDYGLCSHNCQNFARGLGRYLTTDCKYPRKRSVRSDDDRDLAEYIFSIAGDGNCTGTLSGSERPSAVPLQFTIFSSVIAVAMLTAGVM